MKTMTCGAVMMIATACCFGTELEQAEDSYRWKTEDLDELIEKADGELKTEMTEAKAGFAQEYAAISDSETKRTQALGELNTKMTESVDKFEEKLEKQQAEKVAKHQAKIAELKKDYYGTWKGEGVTLTINENDQVQWEKKTAATSKSLDLPIKRFTKKEFEIGAMGMGKTFKIDEAPHKDGDKWLMTIDGTELTRVEP